MPFTNAWFYPPSIADRSWFRIVHQVVALRGGEAHSQLEYIQRCLRSEASGDVPSLPTPEELDRMLANLDDNTCSYIRGSLVLIVEYRAVLEHAARILASVNGEFDRLLPDDDDEESGGIQFSASQVDNFLRILPRVEISILDKEEEKCSICKLEYGTKRGGTTCTEPASESDQGLPGEELPEQPVKLSCGHVFGEWCIKTWLLEQPASCPTCRLQFEPTFQ